MGKSEAPVVTSVLAGTADTAVTTEDRETHSGELMLHMDHLKGYCTG